jgi:uncharacterized protein YlxW (UPF0749 family)
VSRPDIRPDDAAHQPAARPRAVDESMTLLNEVMHRPLDPGYAAAAARRARGAAPARRRPASAVWIAALALLLGLGVAAATLRLRAPEPGVAAARMVLEQQIADHRHQADTYAAQITSLSGEVNRLQAQALAQDNPVLLHRIELDSMAAGAVAVSGPGLVVTLSDPPSDGGNPAATVQDSDLRHVVNALWAGGAEAIAINGHRLTATSAVRSAGEAILVDLHPLVGPYRIEAIGDADAMQVQLTRTGTSDLLRVLHTRYAITSKVAARSHLSLPGTGTGTLYYAAAPPSPSPTTSPTPTATPTPQEQRP